MSVIFVFCLSLVPSLAIASNEVIITVRSRTHHAPGKTNLIRIVKEAGHHRLSLNGVSLPETRIITHRSDLETIVNFEGSDEKCRDLLTYQKNSDGKKITIVDCKHSKKSVALLKAIKDLSPLP